MSNEFDADAGLVRRARSGRDDNPFGMHRFDVADRDLIVAANLNLRAQFADVLDQVVGERIVVVEYENHKSGRRALDLGPQTSDLRPQTSDTSLQELVAKGREQGMK